MRKTVWVQDTPPEVGNQRKRGKARADVSNHHLAGFVIISRVFELSSGTDNSIMKFSNITQEWPVGLVRFPRPSASVF